jgi:hypothetical protein
MKAASVGDILALVFLLALVMLLVRPNSLAPAFIKAFGQGVNGMITYAVSG